MGFSGPVGHGGSMMAPYHTFVVIASVIMKFGIGIKLDEFYKIVTKCFLHHCYYVIITS